MSALVAEIAGGIATHGEYDFSRIEPVEVTPKATPEEQGNGAKSSFDDPMLCNDSFRSNPIGTPRQIADRIVALIAVKQHRAF